MVSNLNPVGVFSILQSRRKLSVYCESRPIFGQQQQKNSLSILMQENIILESSAQLISETLCQVTRKVAMLLTKHSFVIV